MEPGALWAALATKKPPGLAGGLVVERLMSRARQSLRSSLPGRRSALAFALSPLLVGLFALDCACGCMDMILVGAGEGFGHRITIKSVSYTHLTLPTIYSV